MAKTPDAQPEATLKVELRDRELAAFLAWLVPGLGHLYQGRNGKAALFAICILGVFFFGLYLGSDRQRQWYGRVVYFAGTDRLPYVCQVGVGLPALPALVQAMRAANNNKVWLGGFMAPPQPTANAKADDPNRDQPTLHELHNQLARFFEFGTVYTMVAGLLNVLAIYDAWGGPVFPPTAPQKERSEGKKDEEEEEGNEK